MNKIHIIIITALITALAAGGCQQKEPLKDTDAPTATASNGVITMSSDQQAMAKIELEKPAARSIEQTITCTGEVGVPPYSLASIYSPVTAFVQQTDLLEGEKVSKGQVLVTLQHPDIIKLQQDYVAAKSHLDFLEGDYQRKEVLVAKDATSQKAFDQAKAEYLTEKAKVEGLAAQLKMIGIDVDRLSEGNIQSTVSLRAPINGYLSKVLVNKGMYISADQMLFEIVDDSHLHVEAKVYQQDADKVKEGQAMRFRLVGSKTWQSGEVHLVNRKFDSDSKTINIHGHPDEGTLPLMPGAYLEVQIVVAADSGLFVPASAVFGRAGERYVFVAAGNGEFRRQVITVTAENSAGVIVTNAISNEKIVVSGGYYLNGMLEE